MINSKYISVEAIAEKVKKDLPPVIDINIDDIVEYVWDALAKIGAHNTLITLYSIIEVDGFKAKLPIWLHELQGVRFLSSDIQPTVITDEYVEKLNKYSYQMATVLDVFDLSSLENNVSGTLGHRYILKDSYVHTTFEHGLIEIAYAAMPIDTRGLPLIPDNVYYMEAVKWYIIKSYLWRLSIRDTTYLTLFTYAESQWNFYVNSAASAAKIPDRDGLQALMEKFLRIVPNLHRNIKYTFYRNPMLSKDQLNNLVTPVL